MKVAWLQAVVAMALLGFVLSTTVGSAQDEAPPEPPAADAVSEEPASEEAPAVEESSAGEPTGEETPAEGPAADEPSVDEHAEEDHSEVGHGESRDVGGLVEHAVDDHDHDDHHHDVTDLSHANATKAIKQAESWQAQLAIYTFVVFLLLFALLAKFAFKPIAEGLAKREQGIANNIAAAEESAREARELTQQYEAKLAHAADEVRQMIEEARKDAEITRQDILAQARKDSEAERNRAIREISTAKDSALKELATLSANQAVELAGRVVSTKLTQEEQSALIQRALNDLPSGSPSNN